jgi:hypothetical protein
VTISVMRAELKANHGITVQQIHSNLTYLESQGWVEDKPVTKNPNKRRPGAPSFAFFAKGGIPRNCRSWIWSAGSAAYRESAACGATEVVPFPVKTLRRTRERWASARRIISIWRNGSESITAAPRRLEIRRGFWVFRSAGLTSLSVLLAA